MLRTYSRSISADVRSSGRASPKAAVNSASPSADACLVNSDDSQLTGLPRSLRLRPLVRLCLHDRRHVGPGVLGVRLGAAQLGVIHGDTHRHPAHHAAHAAGAQPGHRHAARLTASTASHVIPPLPHGDRRACSLSRSATPPTPLSSAPARLQSPPLCAPSRFECATLAFECPPATAAVTAAAAHPGGLPPVRAPSRPCRAASPWNHLRAVRASGSGTAAGGHGSGI